MDYAYDVFVSYRREPFRNAWIIEYFIPRLKAYLDEEIAARIDGPPARIFFDQTDIEPTVRLGLPSGINGIEPGGLWRNKLKEAIRRSKCMVGLWSPTYFKSAWCTTECSSFEARQHRTATPLITPVSVFSINLLPARASQYNVFKMDDYVIDGPSLKESRIFPDFTLALKLIAKNVADSICDAPRFEDWPIVEAAQPAPPQRYTTSADQQAGTICTFYSHKGGTGRSMAAVNIAILLARWKSKVLLIDWDLEAPSLEFFLEKFAPFSRHDSDGISELFSRFLDGDTVNWRDFVSRAEISREESFDFIHAGRNDEGYGKRLSTIDWNSVALTEYIEQLRCEWKSEYDFIIIDSRTGLSDISSICSIHLPDYLICLLTPTNRTVRGAKDTMIRARRIHAEMPFERKKLILIPILARSEASELSSRTEWIERIATELAPFLEDWIPRDEDPIHALELLRIPYVPYWSFGEGLPVKFEDIEDQYTLSHAYAIIANLIKSKLDWSAEKDRLHEILLRMPKPQA